MIRFNFATRVGVLLALLLGAFPLFAKDAPLQTIDWPSTGTPVVRFTFGKFKSLPGMGNLPGYVMDTTAENLSPRRIPAARFNVYLFDKNKVRVGQDVIAITNVGPGRGGEVRDHGFDLRAARLGLDRRDRRIGEDRIDHRAVRFST